MPLFYSELKEACLENLSSDPSAGVAGKIFRNTTENRVKVDDGSSIRALLRNDDKCVIGNNGTANNNVRFHRSADGVLQTVPGGDTTAEGSSASTLAKISTRLEDYIDSNKPANGNAGRLIYVSDKSSVQFDNGSAWVAIGSIIGSSGNANNNVRLHRSANGILQTVPGGDATAEGSSASTLAKISTRLEDYIDSNKPANGNAGRLIYVSDTATVQFDNGSTWVPIGSTIAIPAGMIMAFGGASVPSGYLLCDGSAVSRTSYANLFAAIGTAWGEGDGSTTFNLPDLRGRVVQGVKNPVQATGSGTVSSNNATFTAHGFTRTGTKVKRISGSLNGISSRAGDTYWIIVVDANTLAFASSRANALANVKVSISGTNSLVIREFVDISAADRYAEFSGGNTGANVGSYQDNAPGSHYHRQGHRSDGTEAFGAAGASGSWRYTTTSSGLANNPLVESTPDSPEHTRHENANVNYIIKT
jgi:microcystin-dependent protein